MTYFTEQVVKVNGSGLIAERANISFESPLQQIPALGHKGACATSLFGAIRGTAQISYLVQTSHEPFYQLITDLRRRHNTHHYEPINLQVGDITGAFYLESVTYTVIQNDVVKSDVSLVSFERTAAAEIDKTTGYTHGDLAHGMSSFYQLRVGQTNTVYDFSYSFRANWQPIYKIGSKLPMQVQLLNAEEQLIFTHENWEHPSYTGEAYRAVTSFFLAGTGAASLYFPVESGIVKTRNLSANPDDVARIQTTVSRIF